MSRPAAELTGANVLVTGGAGFVGSHLVDALVDANTVRVLDNLSSGDHEQVHERARFIEGDVCESSTLERAMANIDVVFHQAGQVSVESSITAPVRSQAVNVGGTVELLDLARREDARVVVASSAAVYGHPTDLPVAETEPLEPLSPYGVDKLAIDHYTRVFADRYDLPAVPLRYFNIYGPRQSATSYSGVISTFLDQARAGEPLTVHGDGSQTRDFIHVSDVVRANLLAAQTSHTGQAFNVGTGDATSIAELGRTISDAVDTSSTMTRVEGRAGDIPHSRAATRRAREKLGFESAIGFTAGLEALATGTKCKRTLSTD